MTKKKYIKEEKPMQADEQQPAYGSTKIPNELVFFSSFEEMNAYDRKEMAALTPIERLQRITEYIKHAYADELKEKATDLKIYFK